LDHNRVQWSVPFRDLHFAEVTEQHFQAVPSVSEEVVWGVMYAEDERRAEQQNPTFLHDPSQLGHGALRRVHVFQHLDHEDDIECAVVEARHLTDVGYHVWVSVRVYVHTQDITIPDLGDPFINRPAATDVEYAQPASSPLIESTDLRTHEPIETVTAVESGESRHTPIQQPWPP
jgi:hypothetical protein